MSDSTPPWLARAVAGATIVGVGLAIWTFVRTPSERLTADIHAGAFRLPPGVGTYSVPPDSLLSVDDVSSSIGPRGQITLGDSVITAIHRRLVAHIGLRVRANRKDYNELERYWDVRVANTGSKALSNVRLTHPGSIAYVCVYLSDSVACPSPLNPVRIGTLQPRERARVFLWATASATSELLISDADRFDITHELGIGSRRVFAPVSSAWRLVLAIVAIVFYIAFS